MKGYTPPKPRALVDMDGTVCDFAGALARDEAALVSPDEARRVFTAEDEEKFPYVKARRRLIKAQTDWWLNLDELPRGMRIVKMLEELGFRITVLTRGPKPHPHAWAEKVKWAKRHIPGCNVTVTDDEKGMVYGKVLVDDWPEYVESWLKRRPRGLVVLPDQPWNQGFKPHPQVIRHTDNDEEVRAALLAQRDRVTGPGDEDGD